MEEKIQENESAPTGEETEAIQVPHPSPKHTFKGLIREMWPAYLIEIIVIILGISITLALEEWRDNSKENRLEQSYLKNLLSDIETDLRSLKDASVSTEKLLEKGNELLGFIRNPDGKVISSSQLNSDVRAILDRPKFISRDASFSDLKSSGNLHLLKDIQLKNLLFAYYSETQHIGQIQEAEQQATITISGAYFMKRFPMDNKLSESVLSESNGLSELKSIEFDNNVLLRISNRKELLGYYHKADSLAAQLKIELGKKIE
jgi:hypothetical protein